MFNKKILVLLVLIVSVLIMLSEPSTPAPAQTSTPEESGREVLEFDRQKLMQDIGPNATEETKAEYLAIAKRLAVESDSITIKDCKGTPMVWKAVPGKKVTIINQDPRAHQITLDSGRYKYAVGTTSSAVIEFDLFRGKGFYSYGCDRIYGPAGILYVE